MFSETRTARQGRLVHLIVALALAGLGVALGGCTANTSDGVEDVSDVGVRDDAEDGAGDTALEEDAADGEEGPTELCVGYCDLAAQVCVGPNAVYADQAACLSACEGMPPGVVDDYAGDSVQCRLTHLGIAAATDPVAHCPHAGPDGAGVCANPNDALCREYCGHVLERCLGPNQVFADAETCLHDCNLIPLTGEEGDVEGNTVHCRLTYASRALTDPEGSCPLATVNDNTTCETGACDLYCSLALSNCPGEDAIYASAEACVEACMLMPQDGPSDTLVGDSVQCRTNHLMAAQADPVTHCAHGSPSGGGVCVD